MDTAQYYLGRLLMILGFLIACEGTEVSIFIGIIMFLFGGVISKKQWK